MKLAIISDIHGNLPALEAVLADIQAQGVARTYCLGDLVGYGAFPNEVTDRLQSEQIPTIMGNYDDGVGFDRDECGCAYTNPLDRELGDRSLRWTRATVTAGNKAFLRSLPGDIRLVAAGLRLLLVHGSPRRMNEYLFEDRPLASFQRLAASANADLIAFGHTHKPYVKVVDHVTFLNVGSVGKPKDHDPRACYVILDLEPTTHPATFRRVSYDIDRAAAAIRSTELPWEFAQDIETGGAPRV